MLALFVMASTAFLLSCRRSSPPSQASHTGEIVIAPQFGLADKFSEGLAAVRVGDDQTGKYGFIDKQGKFVVNPQFVFGGGFKGELARVQVTDGKAT